MVGLAVVGAAVVGAAVVADEPPTTEIVQVYRRVPEFVPLLKPMFN